MSKFTQTEIKLCQDIAKHDKKWKREINEGDWIWVEKYKNYFLVALKHGNDFQITTGEWFNISEIIPLLTLEDCLEFLREHHKKLKWATKMELAYAFLDEFQGEKIAKAKFKEGCLKAVLAILKEMKNENLGNSNGRF